MADAADESHRVAGVTSAAQCFLDGRAALPGERDAVKLTPFGEHRLPYLLPGRDWVEVGLWEETGADHRAKRGDLQGVGQPGAYARVAEELVVAPGGLHRWSHPDRADCDQELDRTRPTAGERGDVGSFRLGPQSEARWVDIAPGRQQRHRRDSVIGEQAVVAPQEAVADLPFVVDERDDAVPGEHLRGRLELLPAAVSRSLQHDQGWSTFPARSRRHHDPMQDDTPAADERHVGGPDGLRLGGRWCNRDTHGCEEDGQEPADAHPPTLRPARMLLLDSATGRHGSFSVAGDRRPPR